MLNFQRLSMTPIILDETLTADADAALHFHDHGAPSEPLPYWLVNLPRSQWTAECPSFLRDQSPKNVQCLSTPNHLYTRQNWEQVKEIIGCVQLSVVGYILDSLSFVNYRYQPDRSVPACAKRTVQVSRIHGAHKGGVYIHDEICGQGTIGLGGCQLGRSQAKRGSF